MNLFLELAIRLGCVFTIFAITDKWVDEEMKRIDNWNYKEKRAMTPYEINLRDEIKRLQDLEAKIYRTCASLRSNLEELRTVRLSMAESPSHPTLAEVRQIRRDLEAAERGIAMFRSDKYLPSEIEAVLDEIEEEIALIRVALDDVPCNLGGQLG